MSGLAAGGAGLGPYFKEKGPAITGGAFSVSALIRPTA
jgi:hypothetical protein